MSDLTDWLDKHMSGVVVGRKSLHRARVLKDRKVKRVSGAQGRVVVIKTEVVILIAEGNNGHYTTRIVPADLINQEVKREEGLIVGRGNGVHEPARCYICPQPGIVKRRVKGFTELQYLCAHHEERRKYFRMLARSEP